MSRLRGHLGPACGLALLVWLPVFLPDLLGLHPPSLVASSPVMTRTALFAAIVCAGIGVAIGCLAGLFGRVCALRLGEGARPGASALVLLGSAGVVAGLCS